MRRKSAGFFSLLLASAALPAWGQSVPLFQDGQVQPNDITKFERNGMTRAPGGITGDNNGVGVNPFAVTDHGQRGLCTNSTATGGPAYQLCLGHDTSGNGLLTVDNLGGAPAKGFNCLINGVTVTDCLTGGALGPLTPPVTITDSKTGPILSAMEGATLTAASQPGITARQIADWVFCGTCTDPNSYDALRGIGILPPGTVASANGGINLVNGVAGYVMSRAPISGPYPTAVALMGMGVADTNGAAVWGINTAISDNRGLVASSGTGRGLYNEFDFSITSTATKVGGLLLGGSAVVAPALATAISLNPFNDIGNSVGPSTPWDVFLNSNSNAAKVFALIGIKGLPGPSVDGQPIIFGWWDGSSVGRTATQQMKAIGTTGVGEMRFSGMFNVQVPQLQVHSGPDLNINLALISGKMTLNTTNDAATTLLPLAINSLYTVFNNPVVLKDYTVAALPACTSTLKNGRAIVTDASAPTYNGTLTGGGAVTVSVTCNGTSWHSS